MPGEVLLHLTDLHFGWDIETSKLAERKIVLDSLIDEVASLHRDWRPTIVCVTGDIGWRGSAKDYTEAEAWLKRLLDRVGLTSADVLVCAGNHDIDRNQSSTFSRPRDHAEADQVLRVPIARHYLDCFCEFTAFCNRIGVQKYSFNKQESYLLGQTDYRGIRFVAVNSAWFCKGDDDKNKLWIGLPHLRQMEADGQLQKVTDSPRLPVVGLIHHPDEWWHEEEIHAYANRPNTRDYLAGRCHLILNGHTHGEVRKADRIAQSAHHLTGGATYAGASHFNSFRVIRIKPDGLVYRSFEYDPRSSDNRWRDHGASDKLPFVDRPSANVRAADTEGEESFDLSLLRSAAGRDAKAVIESKSRQLKLTGDLPATVPLRVSVRVTSQVNRYDSQGRLGEYKDQFIPLPLYEACRHSRRTVLLGDLGSGKSTLAAQFVLDTLDKNHHGLAFFISAKALRLPDPFRLDELVAACGAYIGGQITPQLARVDLASYLRSQVEVCLVVDGLDEVSRPRGASLLRQLAALVDCWPNAQVLATGRPVELAGVSYETWGLSRLDRLLDADKKAIFQAEALANRCPPSEAAESAKRRLSSLKNHSALDELASTPLALRLLYSKMDGGTLPVVDSIGDLLYELLIERLGEWSERDQKGGPVEQFEAAFGTAEDRADVLGVLALVAAVKRVGREEAAEILRERVGGNHHLAKQALAFFQQAGLVSLDDEVGFNFQPLLEMSAGIAMLGSWLARLTPDSPGQPLPWRVAAFAAAVARRRGLLDQVRPRLQVVTDGLLRSSGGVPAACMIASEARDPELACTVIDAFRRLGRKPLYWNQEERFTSVQAIAHTIHLAGDKGFDWFVEDYLDARYPIVHRGSLVIDEVLRHWTRFAFRTLTEEQRRKLRPLVEPLLVGGGLLFHVLPSLAILVPEEFPEKQLLWFVSALLDDDLLSSEAERLLTRFNSSANRSVLIDLLCRRAHNSRKAIALYFKLFHGEKPPLAIARGLLRWRALDPENPVLAQALAACVVMAGEERWPRFLRWCLSDEESSVGGGAAILLYERDEMRLNIVGSALLNALHDGGYVRRAEEILSELVGRRGKEGVRWLAWHMAARRGHNGGHSGFWRVLLKHLDRAGEHGPEILAGCAVAIGPFLLPRYPEVRDGLQRLLTGPRGEDFRKALRARLSDPDPEIRHGAGSILITCDPRGETEALFVVVATRTGITRMSHEWEPFCLSLAFGPASSKTFTVAWVGWGTRPGRTRWRSSGDIV